MARLLDSANDELLRAYFFYSGILVLKLLAMSVLTGSRRYKHKAFANPEDVKAIKQKVAFNENVERVRRAHLNDLENILPFFVIGYIYTFTNPGMACALMLFRAFTVARFVHTFVYTIYVVPQPARAASWAVGYLITGYMAFKTITHFM